MLSVKGHRRNSSLKVRYAEAVADTLGHGLLLITADARIVHCNATAAELLKRADGLISSKGRLLAKWRQADRELKSALTAAFASKSSTASALAVRRANGGRYNLTVVPIGQRSGARQVLVVVCDPDLVDATLEARLQALYPLSPSEAAVAVRLAQGASLAEMAVERDVSLATVRTQLKAIYQKLDCKRQTQVAALVHSLPLLRGQTDLVE